MRAQEPSPQVVGQEPARVTWTADGPTQFAGAMMVVAGIWHGLIGLAGLPYRPVWSVIVIAIVFALAKGRSRTTWPPGHLTLVPAAGRPAGRPPANRPRPNRRSSRRTVNGCDIGSWARPTQNPRSLRPCCSSSSMSTSFSV